MPRLSKEQRSRPLKEENIKAADIFLNEVSPYYEEYRDKFKLNCLKEHTSFDDDIYSDTLLKCYDSIQRNGLADTSTQGCLNYFFQSFKINIKREADYSRNRMRGEMPVKDTREFESSNKKVNEQLAETAKSQYERGVEMKKQGQMSKADVAQLEAQWRSAKYDIVNSETQVLNYKRQLKSLLELGIDTPFDVAGSAPSDEQVLAPIPSAQSTFEKALNTRPEIRSAELSIKAADMGIDIAKRGYYPTIGVSASAGDSHYSGSNDKVGQQMKNNLNLSAGVNLSVPIFDNRRNKSAVEKAKLQKVTSELDLQDKKNALSSTIENYWLNANSSQQRFLSARAKVESAQTSYELLDAQFKNGLKNIVELLQGRDNLVSAKQDELQSKYTTLLNIQLLKFYNGGELN